jgi:hypothetical protein
MKLITILVILIISISCKKKESTTTGNPLVNLAFSSSNNTAAVALNFGNWLQKLFMPVATAAQPSVLTDATSNSVVFDQGWLVIKEIEFEETETPGVEEVDGSEISFRGPYVVNLFTNTPDSLGSSELPNTLFRRIKMKLHTLESPQDSSPSPLTNNSIYFHGTVGGIEFNWLSHDGTEIEIGGANPINIHENMNILLTIRIAPLVAKIDLQDIVTGGIPAIISDDNKYITPANRCPTIDTSALTLFDCFRKGLEQQADLGEDVDGSGEIEIDEDSVR